MTEHFSSLDSLLWNTIPPDITRFSSVATFNKSFRAYFFTQLRYPWEPAKAVWAPLNIIWILALFNGLYYYYCHYYLSEKIIRITSRKCCSKLSSFARHWHCSIKSKIFTYCSLTFDPRFTWCYPIAPRNTCLSHAMLIHWLVIHSSFSATLLLQNTWQSTRYSLTFDQRFHMGYWRVVHWLLIHGSLDATLLLQNTWQSTRCSLTFDQRFIWLLTRCSLTFDPRFTWCYPIAPEHMTIYPLFTNFWSTVHMAIDALFTDFWSTVYLMLPYCSRTHDNLPVVH